MFSKLISKEEDKIFLEAIDQNFYLEGDSKNQYSKLKEESDTCSIEAMLEHLNVKFWESLDNVVSDKELSTEIDSDGSDNSESMKRILHINDFIKSDNIKEMIEKQKKIVFYRFKYQLEFANKNKTIFSNNYRGYNEKGEKL